MVFLKPVEVDRKSQVGGWLKEVHFFLEQQRVGAQVNEFLARGNAVDDRFDLPVDQGFAARDRDDRCAAFIDRLKALLDRQAFVQDRIGIVDLAAPGAGQVAAEQGLEHQHQGIFLNPLEALFHNVGADAQLLDQWYGHLLKPLSLGLFFPS